MCSPVIVIFSYKKILLLIRYEVLLFYLLKHL